MTKLPVVAHVTREAEQRRNFLDSPSIRSLELLPEPDGEHISNHIGPSMKQTH
jgi:hypothetical protein